MRTSKNKPASKTCAIIGDGFSEKIYFEGMRAHEKLSGLGIFPELPSQGAKGGTFQKVFKKAKESLDLNYDLVFCLIDMDTVFREGKIAVFEQERSKIEKRGAVVMELNPCFEIWFLLHFQKTGRPFNDCDSVAREICKSTEFADYCKEQAYHQKQNFYEKLRPLLETAAIPNSAFLEKNRDLQGANFPRSQLFELFIKLKIVQKTPKLIP